ncbi:proline dehydrogenase [Xylariaceae sp. FL0804]|nr:proline dehydrogenase [Xylariaceae sp. FL0804]
MIKAPVIPRPQLLPVCLNVTKNTSSVCHVVARHNAQTRSLSVKTKERRGIHASPNRPSPPPTEPYVVAAAPSAPLQNLDADVPTEEPPPMAKVPPLSVLPLSTVLRNLSTTTISSSPALLPPSLAIMNTLAYSERAILNPDRNPALRWALKKTFYAQFCAGENAGEVRRTVDGLKKIGFTGVILGYAREVVLTETQTRTLASAAAADGAEAEARIRAEVDPWKAGTLETVQIAKRGDFVALKFSGAGTQALYALQNRQPASRHLAAAIEEICDLAAARDVPLLFDAEQTAIQAGIDDWTMHYQRRYNTTPGHAIIYGTYQAYLKSTPATLGAHLAAAARHGFTLGVKLVRGAYLGTDPRHVIHDTKAETDAAYDDIAAGLIRGRWNATLRPPPPAHKKGQEGDAAAAAAAAVAFPRVSVLMGSHNLASVRKARALRDQEASARALLSSPSSSSSTSTSSSSSSSSPSSSSSSSSSPPSAGPTTELAIAQLQGMADEVSCELVCAARDGLAGHVSAGEVPRAYKYIVWGTTKECMKYLLRRAHENRDAVARTRDGRDALWAELKRRVRVAVGWA